MYKFDKLYILNPEEQMTDVSNAAAAQAWRGASYDEAHTWLTQVQHLEHYMFTLKEVKE